MKAERGYMLVKSDAYYILDGADELEAQQRADELGEGWEVQQYVIRPAVEDDAREVKLENQRKALEECRTALFLCERLAVANLTLNIEGNTWTSQQILDAAISAKRKALDALEGE